MQWQADISNITVQQPVVPETTALGAAYAAGLAVNVWDGLDQLRKFHRVNKTWKSTMAKEARDKYKKGWAKAVNRSLGWTEKTNK